MKPLHKFSIPTYMLLFAGFNRKVSHMPKKEILPTKSKHIFMKE